MAYIAPLLRDALRAGLRRYAEGVLAEHHEVPEQAQVPGPDPRNQPAAERMQAGVRMAYWHCGIHEVRSQRCDGELAVHFSREAARFGTALASWFVRTGYVFVRADENVAVLSEWVPWVAHCWGRLMCFMPDAVTPPVEYLTELALPYLRTSADLEYVQAAEAQHREAMDAAAYYYGEGADKNARRVDAGAAPRAVPPYERPDISSWPKPERIGRDLTLLLTEGDRVAINQARKEVDVRAGKGDDVPYLMTAGHHAKGLNGVGWRHVPEALGELELPRGLHVAYPTMLSYYYDRMMGDDRSCLWDMYVVEGVQLPAISLLADLTGGRVQRISPALLHRLERLRLDDMADGSADEHARLQRLLQGMAVLLPKWGDVVAAAGVPLGQTPLPAEADDAANPYWYRLALDAKGVNFPSRAEHATSRSSTARAPPGAAGDAGAGYTRGGGIDTAPEDAAAAVSESPSWRAVSPSRSSPRGRARDDARWAPSRSPPAEASTTRTRSPGRELSRRATASRRATSPHRPRAGSHRSRSPPRRPSPAPPPRRTRTPLPGRRKPRLRRGPTPGRATPLPAPSQRSGAAAMGESSGGSQRSGASPTASTRRRKSPASAGASGRADGGAAAPRPGDARRGRSPARADGAARSTARATGSRRSGGNTREKRPRPSEGQEVKPPYPSHHKWYRVGSMAPEGDALRAHLSAAAVNRLAAAGGAPAGAVGLAISRVLRSGVDRLHASLRTSIDRTMGEAMDGVVKVVNGLRRAMHMEDNIGGILNEVRAADRVASADEWFVYDDSDESGGERPTGPRQRHR